MLQLNPVIGFFDPLNLAEGEFWQQSQESTIGFLREVRWCARLYVRGVRVRGWVPVLCVCCVCCCARASRRHALAQLPIRVRAFPCAVCARLTATLSRRSCLPLPTWGMPQLSNATI